MFRLATDHNLTGWIGNTPQGAQIEIEGLPEPLNSFLKQFDQEAWSVGHIHSVETTEWETVGYGEFAIRTSLQDGARAAWIMPDLATCADCRRELFDPRDRRHRYPFLNCTRCGPRFSIIERLPYDRANTTMRHFPMCADCEREYSDPRDRRFHAQPIACPRCGPRLEIWEGGQTSLSIGDDALARCSRTIQQGNIVAMKGLGGFQLLADARNDEAIRRLRDRKRRVEKPFALMYPSLAAAAEDAIIDPLEASLLESPRAPIVLLRRRHGSSPAPSVAPGQSYLGVMLPYTPLHHLLMAELYFPIVATSGNRADEPMAIDAGDANVRLAGIADLFLTHDRPIARPMDDSVARVVLSREQVLRRARGYAPLPITLKRSLPPILAVGGHLKNAVAVSVGCDVFISQHIGDLETADAAVVFEQATRDLPRLYDVAPRLLACDQHPEYYSTQFAERQSLPIVRVQHHVAHVLSCMADNGLDAPVLAVAWDGAGFGADGTIWGGEFFHIKDGAVRRVAHLRPFPLPGGELAMREPRRAALGVLYALRGDDMFSRREAPITAAFAPHELKMLAVALRRQINTPLTSSAGRLFDAAASLAGVRHYNRFEGQAAMEWEWCAAADTAAEAYPITIDDRGADPALVDWGPLIAALTGDLRAGIAAGIVSARFHAGLIEAIVEVCRRIGERQVVLTGGCFLNRRLLEGTVHRLSAEGFCAYWHERIPTGDGGIALGQIVAAANSILEAPNVPGSSGKSD